MTRINKYLFAILLKIFFVLFIIFSISTQSIIGSSTTGTVSVVIAASMIVIIIVLHSIRSTNNQIYLNNTPDIILVSMIVIALLYFSHMSHGNFQEYSNVLSSIISVFLFFFCILVIPTYVAIDEYL